MKKTLLFLVALAFGTSSINAQNNCSKYYPMEEGTTLSYNVYNKKGKVDGTTTYTVSEVKNDGGQTQSTLSMTYEDSKGKHTFDSDYSMTCTGDGIKIDYMSLMPAQMLNQYEDMDLEIEMDGTDIQLPNNLSAGQQLDDANVTAKMNISGIKMNVEVNTTNRHIEKQESITTSAGTFDCYVLAETMKSKSMGVNIEINIKTWLSEGVGMIKNETFKKNGNLESRTELSEYSK